jgi:hypothetical protein
MEALATVLITIATGTWVGAIIFQSAVVAPAVFVDLDSDAARRFLRTLFPRFYRLGLVCGGVALVCIVFIAMSSGWSDALRILAAAASLMLVLEGVSLWLVPRINTARDAGEAGIARFERLHRISVALTVVILVIGIIVLSTIGANSAVASGV